MERCDRNECAGVRCAVREREKCERGECRWQVGEEEEEEEEEEDIGVVVDKRHGECGDRRRHNGKVVGMAGNRRERGRTWKRCRCKRITERERGHGKKERKREREGERRATAMATCLCHQSTSATRLLQTGRKVCREWLTLHCPHASAFNCALLLCFFFS